MCSKAESSNVDGVIVISVTDKPAEYIIQKILDVEELPSPSVDNGSIKGYEWKLNTKYYSTTVILYSVEQKTIFDEEFCDEIQATIFYFDGEKSSSFEDVLNWMPSLKDMPSEVQLLACDNCDSDEAYKKRILNWCVENQFELVEFNSSEENDEEEEENGPFSRSRGFGRVVEALKAHTWPNLIMKSDCQQQNHTVIEEENTTVTSTDESSASSKLVTAATKKMTVDNEDLLLEEQWLQKVLEQDDPEGESFEALFSKFASMKEKASGLTGDERKKYAEKVAVAFWKAMGGEEDEIAGLDDD